jgi:hypothetical protein
MEVSWGFQIIPEDSNGISDDSWRYQGHPRKKTLQNFLGWQCHKRVPPPVRPYKAGITENSSSSLDILGRKPCKTS